MDVTRTIRAACGATAAFAAVLLTIHLWTAFVTRAELNLVSGVWLTLAIDMRDGVFYRALIGPAGYGGTRYFPLLFAAAAALMRAGVPPMAAGQLASMAGGVLLVFGAFRMLRALGAPARHAAAGAVLAVVPYFIEQAIAQVRADPIAVACVLWGAAAVARRIHQGRGTIAEAVTWLALAFLAKPTMLYAGAAAVAAQAAARRYRDASVLAVAYVLSCAFIIGTIAVLSDGRSVQSFQACALAGQSPLDLLRVSGLIAGALRLIPFRTVSLTIAAAGAVIVLRLRALTSLPSLLLIASLAAAFVALSSPGTIAANQTIEPYVLAVVLLVWTLSASRRFAWGADLVLLLWIAALCAQNIREFHRLPLDAPGTASSAAIVRQDLSACRDPILAESPLVPIAAGRAVTLLDPFSIRVVAAYSPAIEDDLVRRIDDRAFGCVVLDHDPLTAAGLGWYRHVSLGGRTIDAILRSYRLRDTVAGYRVYAPVPAGDSAPRREREHERADRELRGDLDRHTGAIR